jgi:aminoglycoside phosphotransferase (APT) family kinase protein
MALVVPDLGIRLEAWLQDRQVLDSRIAALEGVATGASAQTLICHLAGSQTPGVRSVVLRLESPAGPIFLDTDLERQAEMMRALFRHGIPTAEVLGVETDTAVLGSPFMVMSWVEGRALPYSNLAGWLFNLPPSGRARVWCNSICTMAGINRLDWRDGFRMLDKPRYGAPGLVQYLGWVRAWRDEVLAGAPHEIVDAGVAYLEARKPRVSTVDVLWGDSNPGNFLFAQDLSVAAALDFEAAALGPGEIDLGWWLLMDNRRRREGVLPGLPDRREMIALYEAELGRSISDVDYFEVLAAVRMCLVLVRSVARLKTEGRLPSTCQADVANPFCAMLAEFLGVPPPAVGEDFQQFRTAVKH